MKHNLLVEKIFSVHTRSGPERLSLPGVLSALAKDDILTFDQIRMHQRQAWFCFLVQLASLTDITPEVTNEEEWKDALMELADGEEAMWCLVVDDLSKPAFMQPPVPEGDWSPFKTEVLTPDDLDMLITSKNHDLKGTRCAKPFVEHWCFSLITLQTNEGFSGRANYGTVRMNGGSSSRPCIGGIEKNSRGERWKAETLLLQKIEAEVGANFQLSLEGIGLVWGISWDGLKSIPLTECRPFFIEIVRRIRFRADRELLCFRGISDERRIYAPKERRGVVGDPWIPILQDKDGLKALTLSGGFTYNTIHRILWSDVFTHPKSLGIEKTKSIEFTCLERGNSKTFGFHERQVRIPKKSRPLFSSSTGQEKLAIRSQNQIEIASKVRKILLSSVLMLLTAGEGGKVDYIKYGSWLDKYEEYLDNKFFEHLWEFSEKDAESHKKSWVKICGGSAERQLNTASNSVPFSGPRKYRAISSAKSMYFAMFGRKFKDLLEEEKHE